MNDIDGCIACDLSRGRRDLAGGLIYDSEHWRVEHCVGPLGVGTLVVKPARHVEHLADLSTEEAHELGPLLRQTAAVVAGLCDADQVYSCLWSHGPAHIHFVVQPETSAVVETFGTWGPALQAAMFERAEQPDVRLVEAFAELARFAFANHT